MGDAERRAPTEAAAPALETPPIVVLVNADRMSAIARRMLGFVVLLSLAGAAALPLHDLVRGTVIPRPGGEYVAAAVVGGVVALLVGRLWWMARTVCWTIDREGITQGGPGRRRRVLRWAEVRRILRGHRGYEFHGPRGRDRVNLPRDAIPRDRRTSVLAAVEAILGEQFHFPTSSAGGPWRALVSLMALCLVAYGPPFLYLFGFFTPVARVRPSTVTGWAWVRSLIAWNAEAARTIVPLILVAPPVAYLGIAAWLISRRTIRDSQVVPKRLEASPAVSPRQEPHGIEPARPGGADDFARERHSRGSRQRPA